MSYPDFFILGAMKCGTTTLAAQLGRQDGVFMCEPKEPFYFSDDDVYARGPEWYHSLFRAAAPGDLIGEASTRYTMRAGAPLRRRPQGDRRGSRQPRRALGAAPYSSDGAWSAAPIACAPSVLPVGDAVDHQVELRREIPGDAALALLEPVIDHHPRLAALDDRAVDLNGRLGADLSVMSERSSQAISQPAPGRQISGLCTPPWL
jgi:hypothetical protein